MNHKPTVDNDLQKAIDDITKTTDADPIFSDPVAAPVEDFIPAPAPEDMPDMPDMPGMPEGFSETTFASEEFAPAPDMPNVELPAKAPSAPFIEKVSGLDKSQIKEAALRELAPIAEKLDISPARKFEIYKNVIDNFNDPSVLENAYHAASGIEDDRERGDALLYLIDSIDNM